jgi:dUTP pyrophosphatase
VYKLWEDAWLPEYGSQWAACFDLKASLRAFDEVTVYGNVSKKGKRTVDEYGALTLYSDERILVPTGLVFDLDANKSLRIHPRSGLALKNGIVVANCEGIVDSDYVNQTFVMLHNISHEPFHIRDGDRIAQGEVVPMEQVTFEVVDEEPGLKTDRSGGFGSTGV